MKSLFTVLAAIIIISGGIIFAVKHKSADPVQSETSPNEELAAQTEIATSTEATSTPSEVQPVISSDPKPIPSPTPSPKPAPKPTPTPVPQPTTKTVTSAQVATHNSRESCWTIVRGKVYDVTSFISHHPGGSGAIMKLCGRDGTSAFESQHEGDRRPEAELQSLYYADLATS